MDALTIEEYNLLMEAVALKQVDMDYRNHLQAFLNLSVKAEKKAGKHKTRLVYDQFYKFYDYKKAEESVKKNKSEKQSRFSKWKEFLARERVR